jgi:hypothetical protein
MLFLNGLAWLAGSPAGAAGAGAGGPYGSTFDFELLTADDTRRLHSISGPGSFTLHFDGTPQNLPSYCCGLGVTPSVFDESFTDNGNGTSTVEITAFALNGTDLYPSGLLGSGNVPQTGAALRIGYFSGSIPLTWNPPHTVLSATVDMQRTDGTSVFGGPISVDPATFFGAPGPWDGNLAVVFPNLVGKGVTLVDLEIVVATPNSEGACVANATTLCLSSGRFKVQVAWQALHLGTSGAGQAVPLTSDTGYFWFFGSSNVELIIKVLDGTPVNGQFWVFYGALSNVQYTITVTDTKTGRSKTYFNPQDTMASVADTSAFSAPSTAPIATDAISVPAPSAGELLAFAAAPRIEPAAKAQRGCVADATTLCLSSGRFRVQVAWQALHLGTSGTGQAVPLTSDTGYFWFFGSSNVEVVVKVLDGTSVNGDFWVFYGALSNVQYTITVTDTRTGRSKVYFNPQDTMASVADTAAFPPTVPGPLAFDAPTVLKDASVGVPYAFSFCTPTPTALDLCGTFPSTTNPAGGNPPYHFQLGPNVGFPPFGISLSLNGILSGTPSIQGKRDFSVCAFDLSERSICQNVSLNVCAFSLNRTNQAFGSSGGSNSVTVTAGSGCAWTAASNDIWITVVSGSSGSANGTVTYSVAANPGTSQRMGTMTIAGLTFTVIQAGNTASGYYYANWNCNNQSQCIANLGHNVGSAGPFCSPASCAAWRQAFFFGATCDAQANYTIYNAPPPGTCSNYPN